MEWPGHGELRARRCSSDVTVAKIAIGHCLGLEWRLYWVEVVERSKAEIWAWAI